MMTDAQLIALGTRAADEGNVELAALCVLALDGYIPPMVADREHLTALSQDEARAACARVLAAQSVGLAYRWGLGSQANS